jgi:tetratricopeptide (TPR) repeat protein
MSQPPTSALPRVPLPASVALLVAITFAAYANTFSVPFHFDDHGSILENPTIRSLSWSALSPPHADGQTVGGRPLVNLTLALNYAIGGTEVAGYHAFNLLLHLGAGLALLGVARRTLGRGDARSSTATSTAFALALLWLLHPLQTGSVTYLAQRAEVLAALGTLLTLYAFTRSHQCHLIGDIARRRAAWWRVASVVTCALAMASKETAATAPLLVLLYDRIFVTGSFAGALRARPRYYAALAGTWLLLGWLVLANAGRGRTAGFGAAGVTPWRYALTQCEAIPRYLDLALWPQPLIFDYGFDVAPSPAAVAPRLAALLVLAGVTVYALVRWPRVGFLGVAFFLLLAPSSSVVPVISQTIAEHRMYLPGAAVIASAVIALVHLLGRRAALVLLAACVPLTALTWARNRTYHSAVTLWSDTVAKRPQNSRAQSNLAVALLREGRFAAAAPPAWQAVQLDPGFAEHRNNLASVPSALGRHTEAIAQLEEALRLRPEYPAARANLAAARAAQARSPR